MVSTKNGWRAHRYCRLRGLSRSTILRLDDRKTYHTRRSRDLALLKAKDAFQRFAIDGIKTTSGFHQKMLRNNAFLNNEIYTRWVDEVFLGDNK